MTVIARDFGTPRLQTQNPITVTIFVIRNQFSPVFQNLPYERNMQQTVAAGTSVFRVTATDADTRVHYHLPYLQKNYMLHSSCISKKNYTTVFCFSLLTTRWPTVLYPKATMPTCSAFNKMESSGLPTLWPLAQMLSTLWVNLTTMSWFSYLACLKLGI